jgi:glycosyltransferase involved in cell wall biosynthesis
MSKNILLIGKYPPVQGGVAAKTYWLYEQLKVKGYNIRTVTTEIENYSILEEHEDKDVHLVKLKKIPWHIPYSELIYDRLLNICLEAVNEFTPDIIETNYLWPFCSVAANISNHLKKPLLIRHAGSDIAKFRSDPEFIEIIRNYLNRANKVVTNSTSNDFINELCKDKNRIELMQRYIPDPQVFNDKKINKKYDILLAGKINFYWQHKGIDILLSLISAKKLKALFIIDGNYMEDLNEKIKKENLDENIEIIKFVHPKEMPKFINQCESVWCWEDEGAIEDFSNLIWEACFCNVKCILNSDRRISLEMEYLKENFPALIEMYNKEEILKLQMEDFKNNQGKGVSEMNNIYTSYVDQNIALYNSLLNT